MKTANPAAPRILVADDDKEIRDLLAGYLSLEGYEVHSSADGSMALNLIKTNEYDLLILDIVMPGPDGLALCRHVRKTSETPILFLTAKDSEQDKVLGLTLGADDYVTKPFSVHELLARVKALLRRSGGFHYGSGPEPGESGTVIKAGDLCLDTEARRVLLCGEEVPLTVKEFEILAFLAQNTGRVFTKQQIAERVWPDNVYTDDNTIMVHIRRLRKKIEADPDNPRFVRTVWGFGYRFNGEA